jgi:hypothetical protein
MEWPHIFGKHNVTKRAAEQFHVDREEEVHIHNLQEGFKADETGRYPVRYDETLQDWFHFVINRARVPKITA